MFRKRMVTVAAVAAVGTMLLTACVDNDSDAVPAASAATRAVPGDVAASASASAPATGAAAGQAGAGGPGMVNGAARQNNAPTNTGDFANEPGKPAEQAGMQWTQLSAAHAGNLNPVVVNGAGFTLYRFDKDTADPSKSNCNDDCAVTWPPVVVNPDGKIFIDGISPSAVGAVRRDDGTWQATIGGLPVYRFSKDLQPGDTNGKGVGGTWFGITPNGGKAGGNAG